jgi:Putative Flp pilus-assembly TadE/G-like
MRYERTKRASGQAILWFLATAAACCAVMIGIFNVGQLTSEKQKVVNAADAAAYAGALVEARTLNFMAYTNRTMVATEVLVAQTVSMDSWVRYADRTAKNYETGLSVLSAIPYIGPVFKALAQVMKIVQQFTKVAKQGMDSTVPVVIQAENAMRGIYDAVMPTLANPLIVPAAAQLATADVVKQNQTTFGGRTDSPPEIAKGGTLFTFASNATDWGQFSKKFAGNERKNNSKEVILNSRDAFTNDPGCKPSDSRCRSGNWWTNLDFFLAGTEKHGGTKLAGYDRWEAQDGLDIWTRTGGKKKYLAPLGWGRATAANQGASGDYWSMGSRPSSGAAYSDTKKFSGWKGIPELYDLNNLPASGVPTTEAQKKKRENPTLHFLVAVRKNQSNMALSESLGISDKPTKTNLGAIDMKADLAANQILAVSKARVFFERPKRDTKDFTAARLFRDDSNKEYGSLYNPYWQVRLDQPSDFEKEAALALSGTASLGSILTQ